VYHRMPIHVPCKAHGMANNNNIYNSNITMMIDRTQVCMYVCVGVNWLLMCLYCVCVYVHLYGCGVMPSTTYTRACARSLVL
jgi:hypothetical protein